MKICSKCGTAEEYIFGNYSQCPVCSKAEIREEEKEVEKGSRVWLEEWDEEVVTEEFEVTWVTSCTGGHIVREKWVLPSKITDIVTFGDQFKVYSIGDYENGESPGD